HGLLKSEMRSLGSLILWAADQARVPGGSALAVDRDVFSSIVTDRIISHPRISVERREVTEIAAPCIIATGPLTSDALARSIRSRLGVDALAFYDAIAPVIDRDSIDHDVVFRASVYGKETRRNADPDGAYLNCSLDRHHYNDFIDALVAADPYTGNEFVAVQYFEGCMPIDEMARRGRDTLRFGPLKPVGLHDPRSSQESFAVVQLRQEDRGARMWNMVGFQTRLRIPDQQRVFRMIPGLENADFVRFGSIHRNSYLNTPAALSPHLALRDEPRVLFAGQFSDVAGSTESTATGLIEVLNLSRLTDG